MNTNLIELNLIKNVLDKKGYKWFDKGDYNLNIIGIRSSERTAGKFDDYLAVLFKDEGVWRMNYYRITTDAGSYWLQNPMSAKGTAMLVPGQYLNAFELGLHKGKFPALVQRAPLKVYRDSNKDQIIDCDPSTIDEGYFGINIHSVNPNTESENNDKWSAGCQVFHSDFEHQQFLQICRVSERIYGNKFSYTLIEEKDFTL